MELTSVEDTFWITKSALRKIAPTSETRSTFDLGPNLEEQLRESKLKNKEFGLIYYVVPIFKVLHFNFISPFDLIYDKFDQEYKIRKISSIRKAFIVFCQISTLFGLIGTRVDEIMSSEGTISKIKVLLAVTMTLFSTSLFYIVWHKGDRIIETLRQVDIIANELRSNGCNKTFVSSRIRKAIWTVCIWACFHSLLFTYYIEILHGNSSDLSLEAVVISCTNSFHRFINYIVEINLEAESPPGLYTYFVGLTVLFQKYLSSLWLLGFMSIFFYGALFRKILILFFGALKRTDGKGPKTLQAIKLFHKISLLIENFNGVYGHIILYSVSSTVLFVSLNIWSMLAPGPIFIKFLHSVGIVTFILNLLIASEVHSLGQEISIAFKARFNDIGSYNGNWTRENRGVMDEVALGLNMIYHDLQSNMIGFRSNFFTLSYGFVGTVSGIVMTYSVVLLQFQKNEI